MTPGRLGEIRRWLETEARLVFGQTAAMELLGEVDRLAALVKEQGSDIDRLRHERNVAARTASDGMWYWSDSDPNDLATLVNDAVILITAGQLRALETERDAMLDAARTRVAELESERSAWREVGVLEKNTELARDNARLAKRIAELEARHPVVCGACRGSGREYVQHDDFGWIQGGTCPRCGGDGCGPGVRWEQKP